MVVVLHSKFSIFLLIIVGIILLTFGFKDRNYTTATVAYRVYSDGEIIGTVKSEEEFEEYVNKMENNIKNKYGIDKVYMPSGVTVKKTITYDDNFDTNSQVYDKLIKDNNFTIKCIIVTITNPDVSDYETKTIYVLDKDIFDEAIEKMIRAFVGNDDYDAYVNNTQKEIVGTGYIIESISITETITYKTGYVSTDNNIFVDSDELSRYLLYGTVSEQNTYIVKEGDTISDVATANKLNVQEFLIANPQFTSENNLLYSGQKVFVGLINPIINVEEVVHSVTDEVHNYAIETQYDSSQLTIYEETIQEGENGLDRVTRKLQYINGQLTDSQNISTTELTPSVSKVVVKGSRIASHIADLSYWAWPTNKPYTISSYYAYRWGTMHDAIDITGTSYNSPIYAANNGVVSAVKTGCAPGDSSCGTTRGNYIVINHNIGNYYTLYQHLNIVNVKVGDVVERGTKIGTMGNTGFVVPSPTSSSPYAGTHLHFSAYRGDPLKGGVSFDPLILYR